MSFPIEIERTFREEWPPAVTALAIPSRAVSLSSEDVAAIGWHTPEFRAAMVGEANRGVLSRAFLAELDDAIASAPGPVYPRLGYCSWKASSPCALPARSTREVLATITRSDPRIARALRVAFAARRAPALHLVDWRDIALWGEFRLFIRNRQLIGASQYHCDQAFPELTAAGSTLAASIRTFAACLGPALHLTDVVADVHLALDDSDGFNAELIELNPFSPRSGPCLFSWEGGGDFDGSIRIVDPGQNTRGFASLS